MEDPLKPTGSFLSEVPENGHSVCTGRGRGRRGMLRRNSNRGPAGTKNRFRALSRESERGTLLSRFFAHPRASTMHARLHNVRHAWWIVMDIKDWDILSPYAYVHLDRTIDFPIDISHFFSVWNNFFLCNNCDVKITKYQKLSNKMLKWLMMQSDKQLFRKIKLKVY